MQLRDKFISLLIKAVNNHAIYLWSAQGEKVIDLSEEEIIDLMKKYQLFDEIFLENVNKI